MAVYPALFLSSFLLLDFSHVQSDYKGIVGSAGNIEELFIQIRNSFNSRFRKFQEHETFDLTTSQFSHFSLKWFSFFSCPVFGFLPTLNIPLLIGRVFGVFGVYRMISVLSRSVNLSMTRCKNGVNLGCAHFNCIFFYIRVFLSHQ